MAQSYDPNSEEALITTAILHFNRNELAEAERLCQAILRKNLRHQQAMHLAGLVALRKGDGASAKQWLLRAAALAPEVDILLDLSDALVECDDLDGALRCCKDALTKFPLHARGYHQLGLIQHWMRNPGEAVVSLQEAVRLDPHPSVRVDFVRALLAARDYVAARREIETVIGLKSYPVDALVFHGIACHELGDFPKAIESLKRAATLEKDPSDSYSNLGNVYRDAGDFSQAAEYYERAIKLAPGNRQVQNDYSHALLGWGRFERGWELYESRWEAHGWKDRDGYRQPAWRGEPLAGKRLLVWADQGIGDQIMFASMFGELLRQAASCTVVIENKLMPLFERSFPSAHIVLRRSDEHVAMLNEAFDYQVPIASLGQYFRRSFADFPKHSGYLKADEAKVEKWKRRLAELGPKKKVGISWRGGFAGTRRHMRSIELEEWLPILKTPGVEFVSLQYTDCAEELRQLKEKHGIELHHWQEAIDDYDETAALVCALDGIVSVCTALIHLTGALGREAWILVPAVPEWRYMREGERMPWYPAARLFRQPKIGEWAPVIEHVAGELRGLAV